ncbi:MAG: hypothetical protein ACREAA_18200 [Candidatus Polarisedimenticolia bacterium]
MTDLDALKRIWRESTCPPDLDPLGKEELMAMIQTRAADIKQRTMDRVRVESYNYLALVLIPALLLLFSQGQTMRALLGVVGLLAALGPILAALAYKEYRLSSLPLGGTLKGSLESMLAAVDSTSSLYMTTYMLCVTLAVAVGEGILAWRYGVHWIPMIALVAGIAFVVWAYRSGQGYLRGMFGSIRRELADCLRELEQA